MLSLFVVNAFQPINSDQLIRGSIMNPKCTRWRGLLTCKKIQYNQNSSILKGCFTNAAVSRLIISRWVSGLCSICIAAVLRKKCFWLFLGTAVVLRTKAALWTDGRYYLAAEDELDCNWILMKSGWYYETFKQMVDFFFKFSLATPGQVRLM
jgi:hypothetical protein